MLSVSRTPWDSKIVSPHVSFLEHMEEDEETTKAIPPWVELEYAVCTSFIP